MKNTFGNSVTVTLFGESHGEAIGAVLDGLAPGIDVDTEFIKSRLELRKPADSLSTSRREQDEFKIISGVYEGKTTGTPLCILIENKDIKSCDYDEMRYVARPSHSDYAAYMKYHGFNDTRGSGHFSGRITAALVAAGAIALSALEKKGILIGTHIKSIGGIYDREFCNIEQDIKFLSNEKFAVLQNETADKMKAKILEVKANNDSVGGMLETAVLGLTKGVGEPWFDSLESNLSHILFSIPGVKGVEFGAGFELCGMLGSEADDEFLSENGNISALSNNSGGINGGISNGMPIVFRTAMRPTPTISKPLKTVNFKTNENVILKASGRHDPCIVHRARAVVDSVTAIALCDALALRFGTDWIVK